MQEQHPLDRWKKNAGFFVAGQFLSMFGSMLVSHAITWHITLGEQSGELIALFTSAALLPMVLISPFAGVWADRYNRKVLVNLSDAIIALITLVVAVLYSMGMRNIWLLFCAVMARSIGQGIQQPAVGALIPQIVPPGHLPRFNGIQSTAQSLTMFAAPMAAGTLLTFIPLEHIFFIDVITAGIGIATVFFCVKVPGIPRREKREVGIQTYVRDMGEGWRFIRSQPWMKTLFFASALFGILASPAAMLTPLQVARTFGDQVWRLTAINMAFSLGMLAGGILMSAWGGFRNKAHTMICAWLLFGMATVLFGVVSDFWVYTGIMTLCGSFMPVYNTPAMTIMQIRIPPQVMGRVFSVLMIINGLAMPLGMALFGPLGDRMKIELLLIVTGGMLCAGGILLFRSKALLQAGKALPAADPETDAEQKVIPPENPNAQDDMP